MVRASPANKNKAHMRASVYQPDSAPLPSMEGVLSKRSRKGRWQERHFATTGRYLTYRRNKDAEKPDGSLNLMDVHSIECHDDGSMLFKLNSTHFYSIKAQSREMAEQWTACLEARMMHYRNVREDEELASVAEDRAVAAAAAAGATATPPQSPMGAAAAGAGAAEGTGARNSPLPEQTFEISNEDAPFKIVLVGDAGVGKTNLLHVLADQGFDETLPATLAPEFVAITIQSPKDPTKRLRVHLWDTAGQERYRAITQSHYRRADGALLVYDATRPDSFDSLQRWHDELKDAAGDAVAAVMVVENKIDLLPSPTAVPVGRPRRFCENNGTLFVRCSAKANDRVEDMGGQRMQDAFRHLVYAVHRRKEKGETIAKTARMTPSPPATPAPASS